MFANATSHVGISQRVVATLVASAMLLLTVGVHHVAHAASLSSVSDTISDSDNGASSNHYIVFTVPAIGGDGVSAGETITVTFPAAFDTTGIVFGDVDLEINNVDQTLAGAAAGATWGAVMAGDVLTLTSGTGTVVPGQTVEIEIGTNAAGGTNQIENPTYGSYELEITAGTVDTGKTRVAIVENIEVTAIVNTTFDFTITGLATTTAINGTSTTGTASSTYLDFGELTAGVIETLGQQLSVETNARQGFVVTVETDGDLQSANGAIIDNFDDGSDVAVPGTAWNAPSNNINDPTTWGHWGVTTNDSDRTGGVLAANNYIAASTTPRIVFDHDGPADGTTQDMGQVEVAYQIAITPLQEAADDYNTTLTYIATPTF